MNEVLGLILGTLLLAIGELVGNAVLDYHGRFLAWLLSGVAAAMVAYGSVGTRSPWALVSMVLMGVAAGCWEEFTVSRGSRS